MNFRVNWIYWLVRWGNAVQNLHFVCTKENNLRSNSPIRGITLFPFKIRHFAAPSSRPQHPFFTFSSSQHNFRFAAHSPKAALVLSRRSAALLLLPEGQAAPTRPHRLALALLLPELFLSGLSARASIRSGQEHFGPIRRWQSWDDKAGAAGECLRLAGSLEQRDSTGEFLRHPAGWRLLRRRRPSDARLRGRSQAVGWQRQPGSAVRAGCERHFGRFSWCERHSRGLAGVRPVGRPFRRERRDWVLQFILHLQSEDLFLLLRDLFFG